MKIVICSATFSVALSLTASGACHAQTVVKQEPFEGMMTPGSIILVDDGTWGKGKSRK
jgi:hypothetical protein